jgi:hypothetical protein
MEHLGSGPLWNITVRRNAKFCKKNLWKNLLYIQNFFPFEQMVSSPCNKRYLWEIFIDFLIQIALLTSKLTLTYHILNNFVQEGVTCGAQAGRERCARDVGGES